MLYMFDHRQCKPAKMVTTAVAVGNRLFFVCVKVVEDVEIIAARLAHIIVSLPVLLISVLKNVGET